MAVAELSGPAVLPAVGWVEPPELGTSSRLSGDPLGLRVFVQHLGGRISPGLGRGRANAWGLGLLCAGVDEVGQSGVRTEERFIRWQRLLILVALASEQPPHWKIGGLRRGRDWVEQGGPVPLDVPLLSDERSGGLWSAYARPARMYGLAQTLGSSGLRDHQLTDAGRRLARATRSALGFRAGRIRRVIEEHDEVELSQVGLRLGEPPVAYLEVLGEVLGSGDRAWGERLKGLWGQIGEVLEDDDLRPDPRRFQPDLLDNDDQRDALEAAHDVAGLLEVVEGAFRSEDASSLTPELAAHPAFSRAAAAGYDLEYEPVRQALESGGAGALDRLWQVHHERHPVSGAWQRGDEHEAWATSVPDYGLDAPAALYVQGVRL